MKPNIFISCLFITCLLFQISCSEDLLEPKPLSFFSPDKIYTSRAGFESLLITMRKNLVSDPNGATGTNQMLIETQCSDEGAALFFLDFHLSLVPTASNLWNNTFLAIYRFIKDANVLISRIDNIKWDNQDDRNYLLAEAYFHRSYWYYRLVNSWGDVPFVDKEVSDVKLDYRTHSRWAILNKIQADMEFAVQYLPVTAKAGAPTKGAANHLLAQICLANCEFDKAIAAASGVISGPYSLMTTRFGSVGSNTNFNLMWDMHRIENKNIAANKETILAIVDRFEAPDDAKSAGTYTQRHYNPTWWHSFVKDSQGKRGSYDGGPEYRLYGRGNPDCPITMWYAYDIWNDGGYTWKNTPDLRRADTNWVDKHELLYNNPASVDYGKPVNPFFLASPRDSNLTYWPFAHYKTYVPEQNPAKHPMGGVGDWYVFRLAETYLIRAEANFWKGNLAAAATDINLVRQRSNAPPITAGDVTIDFIFAERARELYLEEKRHNEMVRVSYILGKLNKDGYSLQTLHQKNWWHHRIMTYNHFYVQALYFSYGGAALCSPYHFIWPIPDQVRTANTGAVINQNLGYQGADNNIPPLETIE